MSFSNVQPSGLNNAIENFNPIAKSINSVIKWRDAQPGIARKVVAGAAMAAISLGGLIDAVTSLAFAILTSPALLFGSKTPTLLLGRAVTNGFVSLVSISIAQHDNIFSEQLGQSLSKRFN